MEFLLNNPEIAFILLAVLGLTIFTVSKIVNEIQLNKNLRIKQMSMRMVSTSPTGFTKRLSLLGAQALAPVAVVAIAFVAGMNMTPALPKPGTQFQTVSSADDILNLFTSFQEKYNSKSVYYNI